MADPVEPVEKRDPQKDPYMDGSGGWPLPELSSGMTFRDVGSYGLRQFGGWVREEFLPQLQGRQAARVYREMMDNSPVVGSMLFAVMQTMRKVEWRTQTSSDKPEGQQGAEFVESLKGDMSHTWEDFMAEAMSMLGYGYAPHEIVYKRRNGRKSPTSDQPSSKYNDGLIGWRRLPLRGQDTVLKWFFDENGQMKGVTQQPWVGPLIDLPVEKMLLFRPTSHKNSPEGRSVLRSAYRPYYFMKRMEEQEAILFDRMSGMPTLYVPNSLLEQANGSGPQAAAAQAAIVQYKKIITNIRIDEQMGLILPSDTYPGPTGPSNVRMYELQFVTPAGRQRIDSNAVLQRYEISILYTTLADFIQLGHTARGTQNLALSKVDMFFQAIEGWLNSVAAVINRYALPRLWELNGMDMDYMPEMVPDMAQRVDLDTLGNLVLHLAQAGMTLFPDEALESYIRDAAGMPDISDEEEYPTQAPATAPLPSGAQLEKMLKAYGARTLLKKRRGLNGHAPAAA